MNFFRRLFRKTPRTLSSLDAYKLWAESYPAVAHNVLMQIEEASMRALMPSLENKVVLDLACGTGRYGKIAEEQNATLVIASDNSSAMLANCVISNIALATSEAIPLQTESVDVVLCGLAFGHLPQLQPGISEMSRVLKPGGIALISDFHPYQSLSGGRRTFQSNKTTFAVEHYTHHLSEYFTTGEAHQLKLTGLEEPIYQGDVPVVIVLQFTKNLS